MYPIYLLAYICPVLVYLKAESEETENKYCGLCVTPGTHTMCRFPKEGPGANCKKYTERVFEEDDKNVILHYHNLYRNKVALGHAENEFGQQPPAAGMLQLMWHEELQVIAQRWADQCVAFEDDAQHDTCKSIKEFDVGQNIITIGSPTYKLMKYTDAIRDWYTEMNDYEPEWVTSYQGSPKPPKKIGHYTQLVWGKTQYVGCASVIFMDVVNRRRYWVNRLVCNYGPTGNVINASVYKIGRPCSKCPPGTHCNIHFGGLCAAQEQMHPPLMPVGDTEQAEWSAAKFGAIPPSADETPSVESTKTTNVGSVIGATRPLVPSTSPIGGRSTTPKPSKSTPYAFANGTPRVPWKQKMTYITKPPRLGRYRWRAAGCLCPVDDDYQEYQIRSRAAEPPLSLREAAALSVMLLLRGVC